jgi:hypothetical protein
MTMIRAMTADPMGFLLCKMLSDLHYDLIFFITNATTRTTAATAINTILQVLIIVSFA